MSQWLPIAQLAASVQAGERSATELVDQALKTIEAKKEYNAIIAATTGRALERAAAIDDAVKNGEKVGRLAGVPFIAKDNFLAFGADTTAASNILRGFDAPYQATAIEKLEAEGAICVAKANLDAFAHGGSTENSDFGVTKNPHDRTRVPGGSSGGSAASIVLDLAPFALGTDTGGSIRQPSSFCGVVGLKPTYGLVSRWGVVAMASSLDVIGPLARSVEDAALVLDVMAGRDQRDSTTIERDADNYTDIATDVKGKKIGVIKEYMGEGLAPDVKERIEAAIEKLKAAGADIQEVSLPSLPLALAVYYVVCPAEVSSNLSRYDGQRFGYSYADAQNLDESYKKSRGVGFGKEAKRRIMIGTYVLSSGYYDAYYRKAQTVRTKLINEFNDAFKQVDFLLGPTTPTTAFKIGENANDPLQMYLCDIMTVAVNLVGVPAIAVPAGMANGLPVDVQLMAPQRADRSLLGLARATEELLA
ncbi:MAG TPA: Asp-tRNA(Asn)/Glu-tRNA(Gln) amidotransferase subunit GatA [Candidatus Saccharimonadales bacterium]|jgi:aspartyl-tRNA(Asn)/glutamyl-tRNA(Gln) amidotransferase subunit A|nr:Asp-tRNA(Asn)/Glu-tRNA(Gln) amidotransferase subunit GatA [Candidatus Saccharimonadales bacterium]